MSARAEGLHPSDQQAPGFCWQNCSNFCLSAPGSGVAAGAVAPPPDGVGVDVGCGAVVPPDGCVVCCGAVCVLDGCVAVDEDDDELLLELSLLELESGVSVGVAVADGVAVALAVIWSPPGTVMFAGRVGDLLDDDLGAAATGDDEGQQGDGGGEAREAHRASSQRGSAAIRRPHVGQSLRSFCAG